MNDHNSDKYNDSDDISKMQAFVPRSWGDVIHDKNLRLTLVLISIAVISGLVFVYNNLQHEEQQRLVIIHNLDAQNEKIDALASRPSQNITFSGNVTLVVPNATAKLGETTGKIITPLAASIIIDKYSIP